MKFYGDAVGEATPETTAQTKMISDAVAALGQIFAQAYGPTVAMDGIISGYAFLIRHFCGPAELATVGQRIAEAFAECAQDITGDKPQ